ncbi:MAG: hypothetical protein K2M46_00335 [Lachnospiraceae bacterium]|nr:hypothetical protein [Lachnospiraceae bacterium]
MVKSREADMRKVEQFIETNYKGIKRQLSSIDREIIVKNVLLQFRELFWNKEDISYLENGAVDTEALFNKIENYPKENFELKTSLYEVILQSGAIVQIEMELTTGYICLSTSSNSEDDFKMLDQMNNELILCRGVTQEDIDKKSMIYYHYEVAKKEMQ